MQIEPIKKDGNYARSSEKKALQDTWRRSFNPITYKKKRCKKKHSADSKKYYIGVVG